VLIPWQGWSLRRNDFLLTRLLEIVVHTDDLALSIDVPPPTFPTDAFTPVLDLLTRLAVGRHGVRSGMDTSVLDQRGAARRPLVFDGTADPGSVHQPRVMEHAEMLGDGGRTHRHRPGKS